MQTNQSTKINDQTSKLDTMAELQGLYPHISKEEIEIIYDECEGNMDDTLQNLDEYKGSDEDEDQPPVLGELPKPNKKSQAKNKNHAARLEKRLQRAAEREAKRKEREERRSKRQEFKLARLAAKKVRLEQKQKQKEERQALKAQFKGLPKEVIKQAQENFKDKDLLANYLSGVKVEIEAKDLTNQIDLPEVKYDRPVDFDQGRDTFMKHHAGAIDAQEKLKETRQLMKQARKEQNLDEFKKYQQILLDYQEKRANEEMKAIVLTLQEKHSDKNIDEVLDLHGLKGKEARMVVEMQIPKVEEKVSTGELKANTEMGYVYSIVTGKGSHGRRCVLKPLVERYLIKNGFKYDELANEAGFKVLIE